LRNRTPREICFELLCQIERSNRHLDVLLTDSFKRYRHLSLLDRSFLTELTYGTVRWKGKIDWIIRHFSKTPLGRIELEILNVLRIGLYQILFLSRTPRSAAVNEAVNLAKKLRGKGAAGFVNAILRSSIRRQEEIPYPKREDDPALHLSVLQSHPLWLVQRWIEEMGVETTAQVCVDNNQIAPLTLRTNTLKISRKDLIEKLKEKGLKPCPTRCSEVGILLSEPPPTSELPHLREGLFVIQDEASQLITPILDPQPEETLLDACAAPGGKTTHLAQKMENKGMIYAMDLTRQKLNLIEEACVRLGIDIVQTIKGDAARPLPIPKDLRFDRVLADVPCSGFGTLQRNPDLKWKRTEEDIQRLSTLQSSILDNLSSYLKIGGILVYSTCTVFHEENEDIVEKFLSGHPEFRKGRMDEMLSEACHSFITNEYFKTFPQRDGLDGFFAAILTRVD
jgi:16S rRNA (cytosine967-C5)-methyltransferase